MALVVELKSGIKVALPENLPGDRMTRGMVEAMATDLRNFAVVIEAAYEVVRGNVPPRSEPERSVWRPTPRRRKKTRARKSA